MISRRMPKAFYCSQRCNQRAYRDRQKEKAKAEASLIDHKSFEIYEFLVNSRPDLAADLNAYFVAYKKLAFCEMLGIMARLVGFEVIGEAAGVPTNE